MKSLITVLLLTGIVLQNFSRLVILTKFELNKAYIIQNFCENRNKPKMGCNGKCHLKKQLDKEEKRETIPVNGEKENFEIQFFSQLTHMNFRLYSTGAFEFIPLKLQITNLLSFSIFHPPKASCC